MREAYQHSTFHTATKACPKSVFSGSLVGCSIERALKSVVRPTDLLLATATAAGRVHYQDFFVRLIIPWRLPAWPAFILPVAVTLKRFFALDFVFNLGILLSSCRPHERSHASGLTLTSDWLFQ